jgi:lipopolysaccharide/colanic/teichoic acid biosynthesis glycosyltransferase
MIGKKDDLFSQDLSPHPSWKLFIKRLLDIVVSIAVFFAVWPIFIWVSIMVKHSSPGPVFYRGVREGYKGKPFRILKFRTMIENAEILGGLTTGTNDPRVTWVGRFLRRTKIDELPQIINVLKGEMSLVGPRPEVLQYTNQYNQNERLILSMRPGITDYSSIEFSNLDDIVGTNDPDAYFKRYILPRKNLLRIKYVKEWSISSDFRILWMTFKCISCRVIGK